MSIEARILLDSIGEGGSAPRLTTWLVTMPRIVLAEWNTHRMMSRNAASSRAIPTSKRIKMAEEDPFIPIEWGMNKPGMSASEVLSAAEAEHAEHLWLEARDAAVRYAKLMDGLKCHKQLVNRMIEPYTWVTVLGTGTRACWENFFALRAHEDAEPHIRKLAYLMLDAYNASIPRTLKPGEWHIPYGDQMPEGLDDETKMKVAVARAARLSYDNFSGMTDVSKDIELHDRLAASGHWSAF